MAVVEAEAAAVVVVLTLKVSVFQAFLTFTQKLFAFILYKKKKKHYEHPSVARFDHPLQILTPLDGA